MSPEEKNVIGGIFDRLKSAATQQRDPAAEAFIAEQIKAQPYAPYVMAQSIYAQEQALINMNAQMEQMQARLQQLESYAQQVQQQPQGGGGFLGGLFGGGQRPAAPPPPAPGMMGRAPFQHGSGAPGPMGAPGGQPPGPWGGQPQQAAPGPWGGAAQQRPGGGGMGFLGTAAMTAAGVAGGMLAANAISNMFAGPKAASTAAAPGTAAPGDSTAAPGDSVAQNSSYEEPGYGSNVQDASYDDGSDYGGGGGDDWA
jgi:hypothetical protein